MKRIMQWEKTPGGVVLTCAVCSWWAPLLESDFSAAIKGFEGHVCADHQPLKEMKDPLQNERD